MNIKKRKSIIWTIPTQELQNILNDSSSLGEVLNKLGLQSITGDNRKTLNKRILEDKKLNIEILEKNRHEKSKNLLKRLKIENKISNNDLFVENSNVGRSVVRRRIIMENILKYECVLCGNVGKHNGIDLSLHLDHINGINNDHRLKNLRFLCPNCHSQTVTYAGKKIKNKCECGSIIGNNSKRCKSCSGTLLSSLERATKIVWPDDEYFKSILWEIPTSTIAKNLGISDKAVEKHIKKLNLTKPPRGYWSKFKSGTSDLNRD